jgi:hypothetical protein
MLPPIAFTPGGAGPITSTEGLDFPNKDAKGRDGREEDVNGDADGRVAAVDVAVVDGRGGSAGGLCAGGRGSAGECDLRCRLGRRDGERSTG